MDEAGYVKLKPKSPIAQAIAYSIKRWDGLSLYASTNHLHIDNNPIERCMKNLAVGRKNYLFCGSHEAAKEQASYTRCWLPANLIP
ncbi:IS66 family transposase [Paraflavitalea speifideaquila]|uniref:IS66 family transposase n=1 Tax=Paraflavitalea speifideaquila TaxID=3076558 RepID=UPI0028E9456C|nr:transposase [Paraflavitalea speifideiaquila]